MILVAYGDEAEWLQASVAVLPRWIQHLRHAVDLARACLEGNLDEIAVLQRLGQSQQATCDRDALELTSSTLAVFQPDGSQD